jgi:hypothetical protein
VAASGAMVIGALESQGAQHTYDLLGPACDIARFLPTRTRKTCTGFIGKIGVETLLDSVDVTFRERASTHRLSLRQLRGEVENTLRNFARIGVSIPSYHPILTQFSLLWSAPIRETRPRLLNQM